MSMIYYHAGDLVELKQDLPHKPVMVVGSIPKTRRLGSSVEDSKPVLLGVKCFWFTTDGSYQEQIFNTKDLQKLATHVEVHHQ